MNRKQRKSSRSRMGSRLRGSRNGPTVIYDQQIPPHAFACNRGARRQFKKSGLDHTKVLMEPLKNIGNGENGKTLYAMGASPFIPPYLWRRVKQKKPKEKQG